MFLDEAAIWLTQLNTATWRTVGSPMAVPTSKARGITARLNLMGVLDFATGEVQYAHQIQAGRDPTRLGCRHGHG